MTFISKTYSKILAILLSLLGFSCIIAKQEYGTPEAKYKAKGVVVSQTDNVPIGGIRAVLKNSGDSGWNHGLDTVYTDSQGFFNLNSKRVIDWNHLCVELTDVDGEKNGSFNDKEVEVDYSSEKFTGGDKHWYRGEAEKDLGIIKMEPKE